jgi:predicted nucleic acid-binding protein
MNARSFLDTNLLVYTDDRDRPEKQRQALALVADHRRRRTGVVSTQVLQEYFVVATRKLAVPAELAARKTALFSRFDVVVPDVADVLAAIDLHRLHGLSFWDALIVRSAFASGCTRLLSEDLQAGRRFDRVEIVNPFA